MNGGSLLKKGRYNEGHDLKLSGKFCGRLLGEALLNLIYCVYGKKFARCWSVPQIGARRPIPKE